MSTTEKPKQCAFCNGYTHMKMFSEVKDCDHCGKSLDIAVINGVEYDCATEKGLADFYEASQKDVLDVLTWTKKDK